MQENFRDCGVTIGCIEVQRDDVKIEALKEALTRTHGEQPGLKMTSSDRDTTGSHPVVKLICQDGIEKGFEIQIDDEITVLGRDESSKIKLFHQSISRKHCIIAINSERVLLTDLGSTNGTFVNGKAIQEREVFDQDQITMGELHFVISIQRGYDEKEETLDGPAPHLRHMWIPDKDFAWSGEREVKKTSSRISVRSRKPGKTGANKKSSEIEDETLLSRVLSVESERQKLYLLVEASKALMSLTQKSDYRKRFAGVVEQLFNFKNLVLILENNTPKNATHEVLVHKGEISPAKLSLFLSVTDIENGRASSFDLQTSAPTSLQSAGAASHALIAALVSDGKRIGFFYLDFANKISTSEYEIFELLVEILSVSLGKIIESTR